MTSGASRLGAFARFVGANGVVSLVGSVLLMPVLIGTAGLTAIPANLVAIVACGLANFWLGDRLCFGANAPSKVALRSSMRP
jgi:putative flippase GtrA